MKYCTLIILTMIFLSCSENEYKVYDKFCNEQVCVHFDSTYAEFSSLKIAIEEREKVFVPDTLININEFLKFNVDKTIVFDKGLYNLDPIILNSNQQLIVPSGTMLKLSNNSNMPLKGGAFIRAEGSISDRIENVALIINGIVDANKKTHSYEKSGNEGVTFSFSKNCKVVGQGVIRNSSGDGIDIDDSINLVVEGLKFCSNSGSGIHFGSPRPITPSFNNLIINTKSTRNGFLLKRSGMDISWPNENAAIYINSHSFNNYRNWDIDAEGGLVVNSYSYGEEIIQKDNFSGSDYVFINGERLNGQKKLISSKQIIEFKSKFKKVY